MSDILKAMLSKLYIRQPNCLLCVAPNDKRGYEASRNLHIITWAVCFLPHSAQTERGASCFEALSLVSRSVGKSQTPAKAG